MFVACSTLCFAREPLETALRQIAELEFDKFELALVEDGQHLRPSEAGDNPEAALQRLRSGPSLIPSSLYIDFGTVNWADPLTRKRFDGLCRLAKLLSVAVITLHASPSDTPIADEVKRLSPLVGYAMREGLVLALLTHVEHPHRRPESRRGAVPAHPRPGPDARPQPFPPGPPSNRRLRRGFSVSSRTSTCATPAWSPASSRCASARARSNTPGSSTCSSDMAIAAR